MSTCLSDDERESNNSELLISYDNNFFFGGTPKGASYHFTADDVMTALEECCERTDEYLQRYLAFSHADPTTIIVPKLCLLYAVMTHWHENSE